MGSRKPAAEYSRFVAKRVAHAGGGINKRMYTNSLEALDLNYALGFRYFEIDLLQTADHRLVCLHDWEISAKAMLGQAVGEPLTLSAFKQRIKARASLTPCTEETLKTWLEKHPDAYVVTDIKDANITLLKRLIHIIPEAKRQIIPQVYQPENMETVAGMGFEQIIWTVYRYTGSNEDIVENAKKLKNKTRLAVTIPEYRAKSRLPARLKKLDIPTYVHTINDPDTAAMFMREYLVTEIYTATLAPDRPPR